MANGKIQKIPIIFGMMRRHREYVIKGITKYFQFNFEEIWSDSGDYESGASSSSKSRTHFLSYAGSGF